MMSNTICDNLLSVLKDSNEKIVFAESCTCGLLASQLAAIPGISNYLCGSAVVYRADTKRRWLGIKRKDIIKFSTESIETAILLAIGVLKKTPEANWSIGVVGHLGPDAPKDKDGRIYVCIARRTKKGNFKIKFSVEYKLNHTSRSERLCESTEFVLTHFIRTLTNNGKKKIKLNKISK